ncbi:hypothetical protein ACFX1Q_046119 [Malus domestica]
MESLATKASTDPNSFGWPVKEHGGPMQSPGGSVLWNGISTGARPKKSSSDWWYEDASTLSLPLYQRLISVMESRGIKQEIIAASITFYAKKYLPGLNRRQGNDYSTNLKPVSLGSPMIVVLNFCLVDSFSLPLLMSEPVINGFMSSPPLLTPPSDLGNQFKCFSPTRNIRECYDTSFFSFKCFNPTF